MNTPRPMLLLGGILHEATCKPRPIALVGGLNLSLRVRDSLFERGRILRGDPFAQKLKRRF